MAFPQVAATNTSVRSSTGTSHTISLPTSISAGDLLIVIIATNFQNTITDWDGFTELFNTSNEFWASLSIGYKKATGNEGATITITSSSSQMSAHASYRITGAQDPSTQAPEVSTGTTGNSANPDSDNLEATSAAKDYLWISAEGIDRGFDATPVTSYPTSYNDNQLTTGVDLAGGCYMGVASREKNDTQENPSAFTTAFGRPWIACTVAIHPFSAPAGVTRKIKISGTFQDKPIKTKVAGTFEDKVIKIKVGGTFQDA